MGALVIGVIEPDLVAWRAVLRVRRSRRPSPATTPAGLAAVRVPVIATAVDPERRRAPTAFSTADLQAAPTRPSNWTPSPPWPHSPRYLPPRRSRCTRRLGAR